MTRYRCQECGNTDGAGVRETQEVDGEEIEIFACPNCKSARWVSDTVRSIAGVTETATKARVGGGKQ